jgi:hypothetical protein
MFERKLAYSFAKRRKALRGLAPDEYIYKVWTTQPNRFTLNRFTALWD